LPNVLARRYAATIPNLTSYLRIEKREYEADARN